MVSSSPLFYAYGSHNPMSLSSRQEPMTFCLYTCIIKYHQIHITGHITSLCHRFCLVSNMMYRPNTVIDQTAIHICTMRCHADLLKGKYAANETQDESNSADIVLGKCYNP
eukprot:376455_1